MRRVVWGDFGRNEDNTKTKPTGQQDHLDQMMHLSCRQNLMPYDWATFDFDDGVPTSPWCGKVVA